MKKSLPTIQEGLSLEYRRYKKDVDKAITQVLNGGRYVLGKELERFEERFAELVGTDYAVGVGNGFDALYISLKVLSEGRKLVYICNELHISTTNAVELSDNIIVNTLKAADILIPVISPITPRLPVIGFDGIIIEDACQSIGMRRKVPANVATSCYSFHPLKVLHCYGDGGAIAVNDEGLYELIKEFRNHGRVGMSNEYNLGVNSRLDEIQAAVLNVMMDKLKGRI